MKSLFISQPMRGKTREQITSERQTAIESAKTVTGDDVEVIDSFFKDFDANAKPLDYLAASIKLLAKADIAYFAPGWRDARGCKIEHTCAVEYGIKTIEAE